MKKQVFLLEPAPRADDVWQTLLDIGRNNFEVVSFSDARQLCVSLTESVFFLILHWESLGDYRWEVIEKIQSMSPPVGFVILDLGIFDTKRRRRCSLTMPKPLRRYRLWTGEVRDIDSLRQLILDYAKRGAAEI